MTHLACRDLRITRITPVTALLSHLMLFSRASNLDVKGSSFKNPTKKTKNISERIIISDNANTVTVTNKGHVSLVKCKQNDTWISMFCGIKICVLCGSNKNLLLATNKLLTELTQIYWANIRNSFKKYDSNFQNAVGQIIRSLTMVFHYKNIDCNLVHCTSNDIELGFVSGNDHIKDMALAETLHDESVSKYIAKLLQCPVEEIDNRLIKTKDLTKSSMHGKITLLLCKGMSQQEILKYLPHICKLDISEIINHLDQLNLNVAQLPLLLVVFDLDPSLIVNAEYIARKLNCTVDVINNCLKQKKLTSLERLNAKLNLLLGNGISESDCINLLPIIQLLTLKTLKQFLKSQGSHFTSEELILCIKMTESISSTSRPPRPKTANMLLIILSEIFAKDGFIHKEGSEDLGSLKEKVDYLLNEGFRSSHIVQFLPLFSNKSLAKLTHDVQEIKKLDNDLRQCLWLMTLAEEGIDIFLKCKCSSSPVTEYLSARLNINSENAALIFKGKDLNNVNFMKMAENIELFLNEGFTSSDIAEMLPYSMTESPSWMKYIINETKRLNIDLSKQPSLLNRKGEVLQGYLNNNGLSPVDKYIYSHLGVRLEDIPLSNSEKKLFINMKLSIFSQKLEYLLSEGLQRARIVKILVYIRKRRLSVVKKVFEETNRANIDLTEHGWLIVVKSRARQDYFLRHQTQCTLAEFFYSRLGVMIEEIPCTESGRRRLLKTKLSIMAEKIEYLASEGVAKADIVRLVPYFYDRSLPRLKSTLEEMKKYNFDITKHPYVVNKTSKQLSRFFEKHKSTASSFECHSIPKKC